MDKRKQIEDILLTDYGCFDDWTVDKICDLFDVVGRSEQLVCPKCGSKVISSAIDSNNNGCNDCGYNWAN